MLELFTRLVVIGTMVVLLGAALGQLAVIIRAIKMVVKGEAALMSDTCTTLFKAAGLFRNGGIALFFCVLTTINADTLLFGIGGMTYLSYICLAYAIISFTSVVATAALFVVCATCNVRFMQRFARRALISCISGVILGFFVGYMLIDPTASSIIATGSPAPDALAANAADAVK